MKIVILDGYVANPGDLSWERLDAFGEVTIYDKTSMTNTEEIVSRIADSEIVLTNKTPLSREVIEKAPNLQYIGLLSTGYNIIDLEATREKGVIVTNVPSYSTSGTAQFAIGLLLEVCHRIGHHDRRVKEGVWSNHPQWCFWDYPSFELEGKTMGIIGFGEIGQRVGKIASAMGMKILATGSRPSKEGEKIAEYVDLDVLLDKSDVVSLHCPLKKETAELINKTTLQKMKDGVILVNNARGGLINEADLKEALISGKVQGAALDVVSTEPIPSNHILLDAPNCFITPHISWSSWESRNRLLDVAIHNVQAFLENKIENQVGI